MNPPPDHAQRGFRDRAHAGLMLAHLLGRHMAPAKCVVLGLTRGGVPVAFEIARYLHAPLDFIVVLKLSLAQCPELAFGAVAADGSHVLNEDLVRRLGISANELAATIASRRAQLAGRIESLRGQNPAADVTGADTILVDDGLATGASMRAAIAAVRQRKPASIVVAVPVASREAADAIGLLADEVVTVNSPASFVSVGNWYQSFAQVSDDDVRSLLSRAAHLHDAENGGRHL